MISVRETCVRETYTKTCTHAHTQAHRCARAVSCFVLFCLLMPVCVRTKRKYATAVSLALHLCVHLCVCVLFPALFPAAASAMLDKSSENLTSKKII